MPEKFVAKFIPERTNSYIYSQSEVGIITAIVKKRGYDPENCLYRGYMGEKAIQRAVTIGDDSKKPTRRTFLMKVQRRNGEYEFAGEDYVTTPMNYTDEEKVSGVSVYDKSKMESGFYPFSWSFKDGVNAKDALLGVIILSGPKNLKIRRNREEFDKLVAGAKAKISQ